jgi:hypothetical protein
MNAKTSVDSGGGGLSINGNQILKKPFTAYTPVAGNGRIRKISGNKDEYLISGS